MRNAPAGAASKPLISSLGREKPGDATLSSETNAQGTLLTPPPSSPSLQFPQDNSADSSSAATACASTEQPSARHPNRASLQEGTVFPSAGFPGTGQVPPVAGVPRPSGLDTQSSANAKVEQASAQPQPVPQEPKLSTTSFSYAPNRQFGGAFINFEGGSYEDLHYTSTTGGGMQMLSWAPDRPFVFFENGIYHKRIFSIYQAAQIDSHAAHTYQTSTGPFYQAGTNSFPHAAGFPLVACGA